MTEQNFKCNPPHSCFSCPLPDCILDSDETPEELNFVARHAPRKGSHDEAYEWYVAHGICVRCRKRPALPGKVLCIECKEKACEKAKSRYKSQDVKKQQCERVKKRIAKCKKTGRCLICGKPVYDGHTLCMEHYLAARRKSHKRYEKKMQEKRDHDAQRAAELRDVYNAEKCLYCDNYTIPGKKLCSKHYKLACKNIAKAKRASIRKRREARNAAKKLHQKRKGGK